MINSNKNPADEFFSLSPKYRTKERLNKIIVEEIRKMFDIDMKRGRSWVVDYVVLRCRELGYCPYCSDKVDPALWSTDNGCMKCHSKHFRGFGTIDDTGKVILDWYCENAHLNNYIGNDVKEMICKTCGVSYEHGQDKNAVVSDKESGVSVKHLARA